MKDDSGHFGDQATAPDQPRNADETAEWYRKYRAKLVTPDLTAWQSIPGTVRFAVWLWAIVTIVGFVAGCISLAVLLIGGGWALSQM